MVGVVAVCSRLWECTGPLETEQVLPFSNRGGSRVGAFGSVKGEDHLELRDGGRLMEWLLGNIGKYSADRKSLESLTFCAML